MTNTLPDDARVVKTIGDEVMIVGPGRARADGLGRGLPAAVRRAAGSRASASTSGATLYRDGDYFGREVNLASRVVARARGGEVLVTDSVMDAVRDAEHLSFEDIGQVKLKGFDEPRQLCRALLARGDERARRSRRRATSGLVRRGRAAARAAVGRRRLGLPARRGHAPGRATCPRCT